MMADDKEVEANGIPHAPRGPSIATSRPCSRHLRHRHAEQRMLSQQLPVELPASHIEPLFNTRHLGAGSEPESGSGSKLDEARLRTLTGGRGFSLVTRRPKLSVRGAPHLSWCRDRGRSAALASFRRLWQTRWSVHSPVLHQFRANGDDRRAVGPSSGRMPVRRLLSPA